MKARLPRMCLKDKAGCNSKMADVTRVTLRAARNKDKEPWSSRTATSTSASGPKTSNTVWASFSPPKRELSDRVNGRRASGRLGSLK